MESLNHYESSLMSLENLRDDLQEYESTCLPDYEDFSAGDIRFRALVDTPDVQACLHGRNPEAHNFTDWSRKQLLSLMGVRERWFDMVDPGTEASELQYRESLGALKRYKLRLRQDPGYGIPEIRGIVSQHYTAINDTEVLERVQETLPPDSYRVLGQYTRKEEHITHIFLVLREPIGVDNGLQGFAAVTIRNSEVGASALNIGTSLVIPLGYNLVPIWTNRANYRRVHKGSKKTLLTDFEIAAHDASTAGQDIVAKSARLEQIVFDTEDKAKVFIEDTLKRYRAPKGLISRSKEAYFTRSQRPTGMDVVKAIVSAISANHTVDATHTEGTIAGAVLFRLIRM